MLQKTLSGDVLFINNAKTATQPKQPPAKPTKREGVVYMAPNGSIWEEPKLTLEYISELSESNIYARGVINKLLWMVFTGEASIEIKDPTGAIVPAGSPGKPTVYNDIKTMLDAPAVNLWGCMQQTLIDGFWWGNNILNPVWEYVDNIYTLTSLTRLAPESFCSDPPEGEVYNPLLRGITINKGRTEYYYVDDEGNSKKLQNYFSIVPPQSAKLGGSPMVQPLLLTISYLNQAWTAMGQTMNRAGSPSMWLQITDGDEDTFAYCQEVLKNWGKNTSFPLPENVAILDPHITEPQNTQEAIKLLQNLLIDYFSPVSMLTGSGDGNSLFDNSGQKSALLMAFIQGMHSWLEDAYERLLQTYLIANRYEGYSLRISLPLPDIDKTEQDQRWVEILANAPVAITTINEMRRFVPNCDELDEAGLKALQAERGAPVQPIEPMIGNATGDVSQEELTAIDELNTKIDVCKQSVIEELRAHGFMV